MALNMERGDRWVRYPSREMNRLLKDGWRWTEEPQVVVVAGHPMIAIQPPISHNKSYPANAQQ